MLSTTIGTVPTLYPKHILKKSLRDTRLPAAPHNPLIHTPKRNVFKKQGNTRCKLCIEICVTHRKCLSRLPLLLSSIILPHTASFISSDTQTRKKESSLLRLCLRTPNFLTFISELSTYPLVAFIDVHFCEVHSRLSFPFSTILR